MKNEFENIADILEDENILIKHFSETKTEHSFDIPLDVCQTNEKINILSKFLNSLSTNTTSFSEELYYEQLNDQLIKEAQDKVLIENKLLSLSLDNIDEEKQIDENSENTSNQSTALHCIPPLQSLDQFDLQSVHSKAYSSSSTFSPHEVKSRLMNEKKKRELRQRMKVNVKNIKGDANALKRKKKNDQVLANEDLKGYLNDSFW